MLKKISVNTSYPWLLIIGGLIGVIASLVLSYDTLNIHHNSHFIPSCNLNPIFSCGTVINTAGDTVFGIPYPYYGIGAFAILLCLGVSLLAGAQFKRWYWRSLQAFVSLGIVGSYALLIKSMFKIHALCPFCLSVDLVVTVLFWYTTLYVIDHKYIASKKGEKTYAWIRRHHLDLLLLWIILVIAFILHHFWYYYGKHFF